MKNLSYGAMEQQKWDRQRKSCGGSRWAWGSLQHQRCETNRRRVSFWLWVRAPACWHVIIDSRFHFLPSAWNTEVKSYASLFFFFFIFLDGNAHTGSHADGISRPLDFLYRSKILMRLRKELERNRRERKKTKIFHFSGVHRMFRSVPCASAIRLRLLKWQQPVGYRMFSSRSPLFFRIESICFLKETVHQKDGSNQNRT